MSKGKATGSVLALALVLICAQAAEAAVMVHHHRGHHRSRARSGPANLEFVLEGGLAAPAGDLSDPLDFYGVGKDAGTGYELGIRVRQFTGGQVAISPAFSYVEFGKTSGVEDFIDSGLLGYEVQTSLMRYGVDFQVFMGPDRNRRAAMYLSAGLGLLHNRYRDDLEFNGAYKASVNTPGVTLGAGVRASSFEISAAYTFDRFSTDQFASAGDLDYNWDYLSVRFGLAFGGR